MIKIGLIGCGSMGTAHSNSYKALGDLVQVVAVADIREELAKEKADMFGATIYPDGESLIANADIDAVDICLPSYLHTSHAVSAMKKGLDVFMEKPVCLNEEEAQLLLKTQEETQKKVQIGLVVRFDDNYAYLKEAKDSGRYGKLLSGVFYRLSAFPTWGYQQWFQDDKKSGSCALDLHIHDADFIRYLMDGEPDSIQSDCNRSANGILQHIFTNYRFGDALIVAEGGWQYDADFPFDAGYRVKFEKATIVLKDGKITVYNENGGSETPQLKKDYDVQEDMGFNVSDLGGYYNELKYFAEYLLKNQPIAQATLQDAVDSARMVWKEIELCGGTRK